MNQDDRWERVVRTKFPLIVSHLKARSLLNDLFAQRLIESRDVIRLRSTSNFPTEEDVATELLLQLLPKAGPDAFDKFCNILMKTSGQKALADMLMREESRVDDTSLASPTATAASVLVEKPRRRIKDELLDARVEDKHIDAVKKLVGKKWRDIGRHLPQFSGLDAEDIVSQYIYESPPDSEKFYYVVTAWVWKIGRKATVRKLLEAIDKVDMGEEAREKLGLYA